MDRKIAGIGIGAMLVIGLFATMGFAFSQNTGTSPASGFIDTDGDGICDNAGDCSYKEQAGRFLDVDGDGICDNAADCSMHQNRDGCRASEDCPRMKEGIRGGCHRIAATE